MKRKLLFALLLLSHGILFSQIGINTTIPSASLDIAARNSSGTSTDVDGILIPRVDRQRAQNMLGMATSTMIYVNDISTGSQAGTAANIDSVGFYYYNGTVWVKFTQTITGTTFVPKVVAAGTSTQSFTMVDSSGYNKWAFNVNTNDGNWNTTTNVYTIPASGFYQFSLEGIIAPSTNSNAVAWVLDYSSGSYHFYSVNNASAPYKMDHGGVITMYMPQGTKISFGAIPCLGCTSTYTVTNRNFSIMFMGT